MRTALRGAGIAAKGACAVLALARVTFNIAGGQTRPVAAHLCPRALALLVRSRPLRAAAWAIAAHNSRDSAAARTAGVLRLARGARRR